MRPTFHPAATAAAALAATLMLCACELALHEVQQATTDGCDLWQAGCPAVLEYGVREPVPQGRVDVNRMQIVGMAVEAPYRPCNTVGLVCQGRIIGDVLWDEYVMVLAGQSHSASAAASAARSLSDAEANDGAKPPAVAPAPALPASAPGRIVRTQGTRAGEATTAAPPR